MPRLARTAAAVLAGALTVAGLTACGSDSPSTSATTSASEDPHTKVSTDAEVAAGLRQMEDAAAEILEAGTDEAKAEAAGDELHEIWEGVEGTVKAKEPDLYTQIEEYLVVLRDADKDEAAKTKAEDDLGVAIDEYLAKHPG